jgi:hypothetical protein
MILLKSVLLYEVVSFFFRSTLAQFLLKVLLTARIVQRVLQRPMIFFLRSFHCVPVSEIRYIHTYSMPSLPHGRGKRSRSLNMVNIGGK